MIGLNDCMGSKSLGRIGVFFHWLGLEHFSGAERSTASGFAKHQFLVLTLGLLPSYIHVAGPGFQQHETGPRYHDHGP